MARKSKQPLLKKFIVMNYKSEYFSGMKRGYFYWTSSFQEAKIFDEVSKYDSILKYEPESEPELIYLDEF